MVAPSMVVAAMIATPMILDRGGVMAGIRLGGGGRAGEASRTVRGGGGERGDCSSAAAGTWLGGGSSSQSVSSLPPMIRRACSG